MSSDSPTVHLPSLFYPIPRGLQAPKPLTRSLGERTPGEFNIPSLRAPTPPSTRRVHTTKFCPFTLSCRIPEDPTLLSQRLEEEQQRRSMLLESQREEIRASRAAEQKRYERERIRITRENIERSTRAFSNSPYHRSQLGDFFRSVHVYDRSSSASRMRR
ncbi:hypothetical protein GMRT_12131 [Giardia muris]|uniref:Uncharacterized protein n=1 Tax=Giardia muris TaxID=5742 RepID=A0A4Z1SPX3_GIAMU|nr:hypothetical protein GMRT_12131 [Giardia muris]|eukprot:TNJ26925.1 hypothetical protein GMRT_12131 [Giardia muris]